MKGAFNMHLVNKRNLSHLEWQRRHALRFERYGEYLIFIRLGSNRCLPLSLTNSLTNTQTLKMHGASAGSFLIVFWDSFTACHNQHYPHHNIHHCHYHHNYNYLFVFWDSHVACQNQHHHHKKYLFVFCDSHIACHD